MEVYLVSVHIYHLVRLCHARAMQQSILYQVDTTKHVIYLFLSLVSLAKVQAGKA